MTQISFIDAENRFYSMLSDVINYNDVVYTVNLYQSVTNARFTDVYIIFV